MQARDAFECSRESGEHRRFDPEMLWREEVGVGAKVCVELFKSQLAPVGTGQCDEDGELEVRQVSLELL